MSYLKSAGTTIIYIGLFLAVITFIPGLPPDTEFREYRYICIHTYYISYIIFHVLCFGADHRDCLSYLLPFHHSWPSNFYSIVESRYVDPKNRLNNAERLFEGKFIGPEAFAAYDGQLYTGIHDGFVLRIEEDTLVPITKFGKKCGELNV